MGAYGIELFFKRYFGNFDFKVLFSFSPAVCGFQSFWVFGRLDYQPLFWKMSPSVGIR